MPLPVVVALCYLGAIVCFSIAYYVAWRYNPDCFIVHQDMNVRPLAGWRSTRKPTSSGSGGIRSPVSLEEVNNRYAALAERERQILREIEETAKQLKTAE